MENKTKRTTEAALTPSHRSNSPFESTGSELAVVEADNHLDHLVEVKEEPRIKEEPQSVGELVDVTVPIPTRNNRVVVPSFGVDQPNSEYDFDSLDWDDAKIEVKEETEVKKKKESKTNDELGGDAMANQHDLQRPSRPDENVSTQPGSGHGAKNKESCDKVSVPKTVLKKQKCDFCEYSTDNKGHLNQHLLKHTGEKPHGCTLCPKRFKEKRSLLGHMKIHVKEFLFHCSGCLQGFDGKEEKTEHETNCKVVRYECYLCKDSFGSLKTNMVNHMRVHSGDKPFECEECSKKFVQKHNLNKHMKIHAGPRPFRCSKCHERFSDQDERNSHEEECNRRVYQCYVCRKSIGLIKSDLIRHMRTHSGETPFQCVECSKSFSRIDYRKAHMITHTTKLPFKCLICHRGFLKNDKRKAHQRTCNRRYYECYLCKKFFRSTNDQLKGHMHTHSGEKPFRCDLCRTTFTQKSNLNRHMKNIHRKQY